MALGRFVVQLAAFAGINCIGTASPRHFDALRKYGATPVQYGDGLHERVRDAAPGGVDAPIDLVGTDEAIDASQALVVDRSRIATIGRSIGPRRPIRDYARLPVIALAQAGTLEGDVALSFLLAQAADAHRLYDQGGTGGRTARITDTNGT